MHSLNYVSTIVEHSPDVLRVDRTREVGVTVMFAVTAGRTYSLFGRIDNRLEVITECHHLGTYQELISDKILGSNEVRVFSRIKHG